MPNVQIGNKNTNDFDTIEVYFLLGMQYLVFVLNGCEWIAKCVIFYLWFPKHSSIVLDYVYREIKGIFICVDCQISTAQWYQWDEQV